MSNPDIGFGKSSWYWLFLTAWGVCCIGFVAFLFIQSSSHVQEPETSSTKLLKFRKTAKSTGFLALYPSNKIEFNMSDILNSTSSYVEMLENIIQEYQCTDGLENCSYLYPSTNDTGKCLFDIDLLGNDCSSENSFGYLKRKPCIFLRLEKLSNFVPETLTNPAPNWMQPYSKDHLFVNCDGKRNIDANRMRVSTVWPAYGFPIHYYQNDASDPQRKNATCDPHLPLVAVQFPDLATGCTIQIRCKVWIASSWHLSSSVVDFSIHIH